MATISSSRAVEITIPADYLEDVRSAIVAEINSDCYALRENHASLLAGSLGGREDRASALGWLRNDSRLLDHLLDATGDTKVTADLSTVTHVLGETVRVLSSRLGQQCEYSPVPVGSVLELCAALRWAAEEAVRIEPQMDERAVA